MREQRGTHFKEKRIALPRTATILPRRRGGCPYPPTILNTGGGGIFMASNQTSNYGLNQWVEEDRVLREEFNRDNQKADEILGALASRLGSLEQFGLRGCIGTYQGNGTQQEITTAFSPKALLVYCTGKINDTIQSPLWIEFGAEAYEMTYYRYGEGSFSPSSGAAMITGAGFRVHCDGTPHTYFNTTGITYNYLVIG